MNNYERRLEATLTRTEVDIQVRGLEFSAPNPLSSRNFDVCERLTQAVAVQWNLDITNDFLYTSYSKMYGNPPRYNETSVQRTDFASPLALRYIEVPLYTEANLIKHLEV